MVGLGGNSVPLDVFAKAEKWLPSVPKPAVDGWKTREQEISGYQDFLVDLRAWAALASSEFAAEIDQASRWHSEIIMATLTKPQQVRSTRLLSILKSAFSGHGRTENLIRAFQAGIGFAGVPLKAYSDNGYELLRILTMEYSLQSRTEAIALRTELMSKVCRPHDKDTTSMTVISDTVRCVDVETSKYAKLLATLPSSVDQSGLNVTDSDCHLMLLRNLPQECRQYCLLHAAGETYASVRTAALRFERQKRLYDDFSAVKALKGVVETYDMTVTDHEGMEYADVSAMQKKKCLKCGKSNHMAEQCSTDMTKVQCFKCNQKGHISLNCKQKGKGTSAADGNNRDGRNANSGEGKGGKSKGKTKDKGKAKGKGKKGKMNEISEQGEQEEWEDSVQQWWFDESESAGAHADSADGTAVASMIMLSPVFAVEGCSIDDALEGPSERNAHDVLASVEEPCSEPGLDASGENQDLAWLVPAGHAQPCRGLKPLLSELHGENQSYEWWLLDSGAAVSVLSKRCKNIFDFQSERLPVGKFAAANGSAVEMVDVGMCQVFVEVLNAQSQPSVMQAGMKVYVGDTQHNILSTGRLTECGWSVWLEKGKHEVKHESSECWMAQVVEFGGCPWVRLRARMPDEGQGSGRSPRSPTAGTSSLPVDTVTSVEDQLLQHRAQGHFPFHPRCVQCQTSRSVFQHRRKREDTEQRRMSTEVVADFFFVSTRGEVTDEGQSDSFRFLVISERATSSVGCVYVGRDVVEARQGVVAWLNEFGLQSSEASVVLTTDSEGAVSKLVAGACEGYSFIVRKAAPQAHETVGVAERHVRTMREALQVLRADLQQQGVDIVFEPSSVESAFRYLCMAYNRFALVQGSKQTPYELAVGRDMTKPVFAPYGATVLAEVPDSVRTLAPNMPRFVQAAFLFPSQTSTGISVSARVVVKGIASVKVFRAKNIKLVHPFSWDCSLCPSRFRLIVAETGDEVPNPVVPRVLPKGANMSLKCPSSGPPAEWVREHGFSDHCNACNGLKQRGSRKGLVHSRACCKRYEAWLRESVKFSTPEELGHPESSRSSWDTSRTVSESPEVQNKSKADPLFRKRGKQPDEHEMHNEPATKVQVQEEPLDQNPFEDEPLPQVKGGEKRKAEEHEMLQADEGQKLTGKRSAETRVQDLDHGTRASDGSAMSSHEHDSLPVEGQHVAAHEHEDMLVDPCLIGLCTRSSMPLNSERVSSDEHFFPEVSSLCFETSAPAVCEEVMFGNHALSVWKPSYAIDDSTGHRLDGTLTHKGMVTEVADLAACEAGDLLTEEQMKDLVQGDPRFRVIGSRWVTTDKSTAQGPAVRARIVIKDIARGADSARHMNVSTPTPSSEALRIALATAAYHQMMVSTFDVSHAFMHTPIRHRVVIIRLPRSVSGKKGEAMYLWLNRVLNGLRCASGDWLSFLSEIVEAVGLASDLLEPCLFTGRSFSSFRPVLVIVYVDDIMICFEATRDRDEVTAALRKHVPLKETGFIGGASVGGRVKFIGRDIFRVKGSWQLLVRIPPHYLNDTFKEYGISKASSAIPDVSTHVEKASKTGEKAEPLSSETYQRFRRALGKISWMAQTREDLKAHIAILSLGQSQPTQHHEAALRAFRWLFGDMDVALGLPALTETACASDNSLEIRVFVDASHAPLRSTCRRGISGSVAFVFESMIKSFSRHQGSIALSSCESELIGIQTAAQEAVALRKTVARIAETLGLEGTPSVRMITDSRAATDLVRGSDLPRRSRHIEIKIQWIKELVEQNILELEWQPGESNCADMLTKCLDTSSFLKHRHEIGFEKIQAPLESLCAICDEDGADMLVIEVCCSQDSALRKVCRKSKITSYLGISKAAEARSTGQGIVASIAQHRELNPRGWVHIHVASPCASEIGLSDFREEEIRGQAFAMLEPIVKNTKSFLQVADSISWEWPLETHLWKFVNIPDIRSQLKLHHESHVHLCMTGLVDVQTRRPLPKVLKFMSSHREFGEALSKLATCTCEKHAQSRNGCLPTRALYTHRLAQAIFDGIQRIHKDCR